MEKSLPEFFNFSRLTNFWKYTRQDLGQSTKEVFCSLPLDTSHFGSESEPKSGKKIHMRKGKQKIAHLWGIHLLSKHIRNNESQVSHCPKERQKYELKENWEESCVRQEFGYTCVNS